MSMYDSSVHLLLAAGEQHELERQAVAYAYATRLARLRRLDRRARTAATRARLARLALS